MSIYNAAWIAIGLELLLLAIWMYSVYFSKNGTDAAGKGVALIYLLALASYILIGLLLMLVNNKYCSIAVITMFIIPLLVVVYGLLKKYT